MAKINDVSGNIVVATVAKIIPMVLRAVAKAPSVFPNRQPLLAAAMECEAATTIDTAHVAATGARLAIRAVTPQIEHGHGPSKKIADEWLEAIYSNNRPLAATLIGYGSHHWAVFAFAESAVYFAVDAARLQKQEPETDGWRGMEPVSNQNMRTARVAVEYCGIVATSAAKAVAVYDPAVTFHEGQDWKWAQALEAGEARKVAIETSFAEILSPWAEFEPAILARAAMAPLLDEAFQ